MTDDEKINNDILISEIMLGMIGQRLIEPKSPGYYAVKLPSGIIEYDLDRLKMIAFSNDFVVLEDDQMDTIQRELLARYEEILVQERKEMLARFARKRGLG